MKKSKDNKRPSAPRIAERIVTRHLDDVELMFSIIERDEEEFRRLLNALGVKDQTRRIADTESKLRAALPKTAHATLLELHDEMVGDSTIRLQAGFLLGLSVGRMGGVR